MKNPIATTVLCGFIARSSAHFTTPHLLVNKTDTGLWKHVLEVGIVGNPLTNGGFPAGSNYPKVVPQYTEDLFTPNITCGRVAFNSLEKTEIADDIADDIAGEEVGFRVMSGAEMNGGGGYGHFYHHGPAQVWLSRAPNDDLKSYRGDGDWFKVAYQGPRVIRGGSCTYNFTLPRTTPPGKYLMRFEFLLPTSSRNYTQWYINCALVNIMGSGGGTPMEFVKFPGAYDVDDLGLWVPFNQDADKSLPEDQMRLLDYKPPGPLVWTR